MGVFRIFVLMFTISLSLSWMGAVYLASVLGYLTTEVAERALFLRPNFCKLSSCLTSSNV